MKVMRSSEHACSTDIMTDPHAMIFYLNQDFIAQISFNKNIIGDNIDATY